MSGQVRDSKGRYVGSGSKAPPPSAPVGGLDCASAGGSKIVVGVKGASAIQRKLATMAKVVPERLGGALHREARLAVTKTNQSYVPKDLSALANSAGVDDPKIEPGEISVLVYYGGPSAPYAQAIHEHPSDASPRSWKGKEIGDIKSVRTSKPWSLTGRGPKYLERGLKEILPGMGARLVKDLNKILAGAA